MIQRNTGLLALGLFVLSIAGAVLACALVVRGLSMLGAPESLITVGGLIAIPVGLLAAAGGLAVLFRRTRKRWEERAGQARREWSRSGGWREVMTPSAPPEWSTLALPVDIRVTEVISRFDGQIDGKWATVQTWRTHRPSRGSGSGTAHRREIVAVEAAGVQGPLMLRPPALARRATERLRETFSVEAPFGESLVAGPSKLVAHTMPLLGDVPERVGASTAMMVIEQELVIVSAPDDSSVDALEGRLRLAADVADRLPPEVTP